MRFPGATHLVILSRGKAAEALRWTGGVLERLGLTRNEKKTSLRNARREEKVGEYLTPGNNRPWEEVRDRLNQKLKGWKGYFNLGSTERAYRAIDEYVEERVRGFLKRRHKVSTQGTREFSMKRIFGELGVFRLRGPLGDASS